MPQYRYLASRQDGAIASGVIEASTAAAATDIVWSEGLTPFEVRAVRASEEKWWRREIFVSQAAIAGDLNSFTRDLSSYIVADIPVDEALRVLSAPESPPRVRAFSTQLLSDVTNGASLSQAMERQRRVFPADYVAVIRAAEIGGTLGHALLELADVLDRGSEVRTSVQSALIYPSILVVLTFVTVAIIAGGLVPSIEPLFAQSGQDTPTTIWLLSLLSRNWMEVAGGAVLACGGLLGLLAIAWRRPAVQQEVDRRSLALPILGRFLLQQETARFSRTLGTMLKSGVPLDQALSFAREVVGNVYLRAGLERAIEAVHQGVSLNKALGAQTEISPPVLRMISIGEETGKLDAMLLRVATMLERQIKTSIDRFMAVLPPILTVIIAVSIGALMMPIMSAVLSINDMVLR